jgi:mono/diheme cytochrome c family protein
LTQTRWAPSAWLAIAAALFLVLVLPQYGRAGGSEPTFTSTQAASGATLFASKCAMCHGAQLEGGAGPALDGPNFKTLNDKVHATVSDVFGYITTNMPMNAPASLTHDQYVDVMAFILSKNGYKPGPLALTWTTANASTAHVVNEGR